MSSIKDVARLAGLSTATVSRALANKTNVTVETRERVEKAVAELGYRPNRIARSLRVQTSTKIGLVLSDIRNPFFTEVARAVEDAAYERGYSVMMCNTDESQEKEQLYLDMMQDENVAGVIFSPTQQFDPARQAERSRMPMVIIDRSIDLPKQSHVCGYDMVLLDNFAAGYALANHMIEQGCRRLVGVFGSTGHTGKIRCDGFRRALADHGLSSLAEYFVPPRQECGYEQVAACLQSGLQPDGIMTSNSLLCAGAYQALRQADCRIPQDVMLSGFDETFWSSIVEPDMTVISQPTKDIGHLAVSLLLARIAEPTRLQQTVYLQGTLLARGSTADF